MVKSPTRSELQVTSQSSISPPIESNSENSSDVTQPTHAGSKLLEDKQTNEFLISVSKKEVSDMMRQRNREKNFCVDQHIQAKIRMSPQFPRIIPLCP